MFKRIVFGATALAMFWAHIPQAFAYYPVGNTILVPKNEQASTPVMITGEFGYTFDENESNSAISSIQGKITYMDLLDGRIRPYITLGGLKYSTVMNVSKQQTNGEFIWGLGLEAILYEWQDIGVTTFASIGYREAELNLRKIPDDHTNFQLFETSLGLAKSWGNMQLYAGISYWNVKDIAITRQAPFTIVSPDTEDSTEPFLGINFKVSDTVSLGFEVNRIDDDITTFLSYSMQF